MTITTERQPRYHGAAAQVAGIPDHGRAQVREQVPGPDRSVCVPSSPGRQDRGAGDRGCSPGGFGQIYVPPGWPDVVRPPGAPDWEASAISFLLDCCPADYRGYAVLRRHPVVLARMAAEFVEGQIRASREALSGARSSLQDFVSGDVLDRATEMMLAEGARLIRTRRAVMLVEEALRGRIFIRKL